MNRRSALILAVMLTSAPLHAQDDEGSGPEASGASASTLFAADDSHAATRARLYNALTETTISIEFDAAPAREALETLAERLPAPLIARFWDDSFGYGIDPLAPVTAAFDETPALEALEEILEQVSLESDPCTWQLRRGFIEAGTKSRLCAPAARERRLYYVRDLMLREDQDLSIGATRVPGDALALDLVELIVTTIEPELWDWGQIDYESLTPPPDDEGPAPTVGERPGDEGAAKNEAPPRDGRSPAHLSAATTPRYVRPAKPAIIRHWRDVLIVDAPDFVHRQLGGYPEPAGK